MLQVVYGPYVTSYSFDLWHKVCHTPVTCTDSRVGE